MTSFESEESQKGAGVEEWPTETVPSVDALLVLAAAFDAGLLEGNSRIARASRRNSPRRVKCIGGFGQYGIKDVALRAP